jgi:deoxyribodipyrimidine photolyase-related protein
VKPTLLICGDQLFAPARLRAAGLAPDTVRVLMVEDAALCRRRTYHQQKLTLVLAAMRSHRDALEDRGYRVDYITLEDELSLAQVLKRQKVRELVSFTAVSKGQRAWIRRACRQHDIAWQERPSPMFLTNAETFEELAGTRLPLNQGRFYTAQRRRLNILMTAADEPVGGQFSFDEDNRRKLPKKQAVPELPNIPADDLTQATARDVARHFPDHPGAGQELWLPVSRAGALRWLRTFLEERFAGFGTYEDAISQRSWSLFHSALSPLLNLGLLTPDEVLERALAQAEASAVPINDVEGFTRQLIGWREFVHGVYQRHGEDMRHANQRRQTRRLTDSWHEGALGIPPYDDAVKTMRRYGWNHHIERLMVIANLMNLAEIQPLDVHEFFMTWYLDAYDWVMVPNVYGMGLNSDDNTFATKPYICGSNYWLKMSDYGKGDWTDVVDGLYWRFVREHRDTLARNPRTAMMPRNLDRLKGTRKTAIFAAADQFLKAHTR